MLIPTLFLAAEVGGEFRQDPAALPLASGPYSPTMASLQTYECPEWFRDAKFGIWSHWGPQAVPGNGDWYARGMYEEGSGHYKYHVANYGHPTKFGYKDIIPLWKAEKWDPEQLMKLYKAAGAKYFVSMGTHHDNFFLWDSKIHPWNSVNMGPKKDVVRIWQEAAKKEGLRFGVSEHLGASYTWFQKSRGADKEGPFAGIPYDGTNPHFTSLYHEQADAKDTGWYTTNPKWHREWYRAVKELVDMYQPDLLYTDGAIPFGNEVGLSMVAHLYNQDAARHGGKSEAVYNCKQVSDGRWVEDVERGVLPKINPHPWQTDTSIGDWYYNRNWTYRPISWVIGTLVDVVSKNGNLLLNVVQRPDGSLDPEVEEMLKDLATWNKIHESAIYGTRPWQIYGESKQASRGGAFNEEFRFSAEDIRFTTKGDSLYAIALGYPSDGKVLIRSLAKTDDVGQNQIQSISLLGHEGRLTWTQDAEGLHVVLPQVGPSPHTAGLRIEGKNLKAVPIPKIVHWVEANAEGALILGAKVAELDGQHLNLEARDAIPNLGYWDGAADTASWHLRVPKAGAFNISASLATLHPETHFVIEGGKQPVKASLKATGGWDRFQEVQLGNITFDRAGEYVIRVRPKDAASWKPMNLRHLTLRPAKPEGESE